MSKVKNIDELRDHLLDTLDQLEQGLIDTYQASITSKVCEGIIATIKVQMDYAKMVEKTPAIGFVNDSMQTIQDVTPRTVMLERRREIMERKKLARLPKTKQSGAVSDTLGETTQGNSNGH